MHYIHNTFSTLAFYTLLISGDLGGPICKTTWIRSFKNTIDRMLSCLWVFFSNLFGWPGWSGKGWAGAVWNSLVQFQAVSLGPGSGDRYSNTKRSLVLPIPTPNRKTIGFSYSKTTMNIVVFQLRIHVVSPLAFPRHPLGKPNRKTIGFSYSKTLPKGLPWEAQPRNQMDL